MAMTTDEIFNLLRNDSRGRFFSVVFERRTTNRLRNRFAGELRRMLCRSAGTMSSYKLGAISDEERDEEDLRCGVVTVWSMDAYMEQRRREINHETAALRSWRRIDLMGLKECSIVDATDLPPTYRPHLHRVTNPFRSQHMPEVAIQ